MAMNTPVHPGAIVREDCLRPSRCATASVGPGLSRQRRHRHRRRAVQDEEAQGPAVEARCRVRRAAGPQVRVLPRRVRKRRPQPARAGLLPDGPQDPGQRVRRHLRRAHHPLRLLSREFLCTALTRHQDRMVILHEGPLVEYRRYAGDEHSEIARRMTNLFADPLPREVTVNAQQRFLARLRQLGMSFGDFRGFLTL